MDEEMEALFSKDESKKVQMYDLALRVTDKPIDFEEIYKSYLDFLTRGKAFFVIVLIVSPASSTLRLIFVPIDFAIYLLLLECYKRIEHLYLRKKENYKSNKKH